MQIHQLKQTIRQIPDFPRPGINFYDVSTLMAEGPAFRAVVEKLVQRFHGEPLDALAGIEARGFVLAAAMAYELRLGLLLLRKSGKLPGETDGEDYDLEYGDSRIEVHRDTVHEGQRVLIVDDLLATGGTAAAAGRLLERLGATVQGYGFMVELGFLEGRKRLDSADVFALIRYDE